MKSKGFHLVWLVILLVILLGCATKSVPITAPTQAAPPLTTAPTSNPSLPISQSPTSQEAAWAKIVSDARKEGRVTMYTFGFVGDWGKEVINGFEKAYGIKVETVGGVGAILMERIKTEKAAGRYIADTYDSAPSFLISAKVAGLTDRTELLPELEKKVDWRLKPVDPDKTMFPYYLSIGTPYGNTSLIKAGQEPKSYQELLQPQWKGKITMAAPALDPTGIYPYVAAKKYGIREMGDDYYRQLGKQDLKLAPTVRDVAAMVTKGEAAIGFQSTAGIMNAAIAAGAPVKPLAMEEGQVLTWGATIARVKNAPHPNAATVLINWLLTAEGQAATNRARGALPIRQDLPDFGPEGARLEIKKPLVLEIPDLIDMSRLQRESVVDKIMGLEVK